MDTATFEISKTCHSQEITKKQFQQQLIVARHKQTSLRNMYIEEKYFILFQEKTDYFN